MNKLRVGVIGQGGRGYALLQMFCKMKMIDVIGICDLYPEKLEKTQKYCEEAGYHKLFTTTDYKELIKKELIDCVVVATGWSTHAEICIYAMKAGVAVGSEVGGANNIEECFELVRVYEETKTPYMFCENCNYGERELAVIEMVKQGLFGEIVHCEGAYGHDLREMITMGRITDHYRYYEYLERNNENYPSHEFGPLMKVLDINHSNRLTSLVAISSKTRGMNAWAKEHLPEEAETQFAQGDVVTTLLTCKNGETVVLSLDTSLPRPYSRRFTVRGTKGMYAEDNDSVFIDVKDAEYVGNWRGIWGNAQEYCDKYAPIWAEMTQEEKEAGHGGMDWLCYKDFFEHVISGEPMPIDVYDGAAIMAITPLSEISIKAGSMPVAFPDFKKNA